MSLDKNYFVIAGFDLTDNIIPDKFQDWKELSYLYENYVCFQRRGNIQLFDDPMDGEHLYIGYILADGDEYSVDTVKIGMNEIYNVRGDVEKVLLHFENIGIIKDAYELMCHGYQIIVFEECY